MSECVVRMKMPHDGLCDLAFSLLDRTCCTIEGNLCNYCDDGVIPKWCPIICELPEGHGRLIDASYVIDVMQDELDNDVPITVDDCFQIGCKIPTIVPAEAERSEHERTD